MKLISSLILAILIISSSSSSAFVNCDGDLSEQQKVNQYQKGDSQGEPFEGVYSGETGDRIRVGLRNYVDNFERSIKGQLYAPTVGFTSGQTILRPVRQTDLNGIDSGSFSKWLESSLNPTGHHAISGREAGQEYVGSLEYQAPSGRKMTRNGQPVFMRLPPRFGKRHV